MHSEMNSENPNYTGKITIIGAAYGTVDVVAGERANRCYDVTETLQGIIDREAVSGKDFEFTPNNTRFGDPAPHHDKRYGFVYTNYFGTRLAAAGNEGETMVFYTDHND